MDHALNHPSPLATRFRRFCRRDVYWILAISFLLALLLFQAFGHRHYSLKPPVPLLTSPYAGASVTIPPGERTPRAWLDDWAGQTHAPFLILLDEADNSLAFALAPGTSTLEDALTRLKVHGFTFEYEKDRIVIGSVEAMLVAGRKITVAYTIGDLLDADDPFTTRLTREGRFQALLELLEAVAVPEEWRTIADNGNWAQRQGDQLFVTATPAIQWKIEQILGILRSR